MVIVYFIGGLKLELGDEESFFNPVADIQDIVDMFQEEETCY